MSLETGGAAAPSGSSSTAVSGGTGGATAGQTTGSSSTTGAPSAGIEWTTGLNEDLRGYVQNKGFKDPGAVVESYRNLEKLQGVPKERLLKLPEKADDPSWGEVYNRLGRPEKPDGYQLPTKEGDDGAFTKAASEWFHELGLSKSQAQGFVAKFNEHSDKMVNDHKTRLQNEATAQSDGLKKEWGAAYDQNIGLAKRAMQTFGIDGATIDKLENVVGFTDVMKLMHNIGAKVGEDKFISGSTRNPGFGVQTPEAAKNKMASLRNDSEFIRKLDRGDAGARDEWNKLNKWSLGISD